MCRGLIRHTRTFATRSKGSISSNYCDGVIQPPVSFIDRGAQGLLQVSCLDGALDLNSNPVERSIRPIALHRKNALFAGSDEGGDSCAVIATLIENCKLSGINPHDWLTRTDSASLACRAQMHTVGTSRSTSP
jgi:hypothetical protein